VSRRGFLVHGGTALAVGVLAPSLLNGEYGSLVPASSRSEPALTQYRMPYGSTPLQPGAPLSRVYDELALLAALQGIVNRDAPRLYVLGVSGGGIGDLDQFWWEQMAALGWSVAKQEPYMAKDLNDLLSIYGRRAKGLVVWDPAVPATQNVAATLAGVHDLLPVAYRSQSGSLYPRLRQAGWGVGAWLVQQDGTSLFTGTGTIPGTELASTGSAKNDAYLWAKVHCLDAGLCDPTHMAYYIDAYWLQNPSAADFWNNTLVNHDYFVAHRGFFFDLDPWPDEAPVDDPHQRPGTDAATLQALLVSANQRTGGQQMINVGGFVPWAFKYTDFGRAGGTHAAVPTEWEYAESLSWYNAFMEADALGYSAIANASFTQHLPLEDTYPQPAVPDRAALHARDLITADGSAAPRRFFAFYVGDFDSPAWLYQKLPSLWNDPARGHVPLSWAFDPNLALRAAPAMAWTRQTRSRLDTFVAGDSGAGYLNPGALETPRASGLPSGIETWAAHCARFYRQWDISLTGFILEGNAPGLRENGLRAYAQFSPRGVVGQKLPSLTLVDGMPVLGLGPDIGGSPSNAAAAVEKMFAPVSGAQFGVARAVLQSPSWYLAVADQLNASGIEVLDLVSLMALLGQHLQAQSHATHAPRATLTAAAGLIQLSGMRVVPAGDSVYTLGTAGGEPAVIFQKNPYNPGGASYLYLSVDRGGPLTSGPPKTIWIEMRYYDSPAGLQLLCEYDSDDTSAPLHGAYTPTAVITTGGSATWKTVLWPLNGADFTGAQNNGADLRIDGLPGLALHQITLSVTQPHG